MKSKDAEFRVLLVDDDEDDFVLIRDLFVDLRFPKFYLEWTKSYDQAFDMISQGHYDAYLVDYRLGQKSGLELLKQVRSEGIDATFILLTGYGDHDVDMAAMEFGASDYLVKTELNSQILERAIRYAINRDRALVAIREREEDVRSLFDATFEGIVVHRLTGEIQKMNSTAKRIFDLADVDETEKNFFELAPGAELKVRESLRSNSPYAVEMVTFEKENRQRYLEVASKPYVYQGEQVVLTACREVSERMQMEAQILRQDRLASIGLLSSSLAHEIGTPLGVIRGRAEFLALQVGDDPNVRKTVDIIISQIDRVSKLIRSLLTLARGEGSARVEPVVISDVLNEVVDLLRHEFAAHRIHFQSDLDDSALVMAESGPLHQVFLNLLVNSIHAIDLAQKQGRSDGHFVKILQRTEGDFVRVTVSDSGSGISTSNLKQLFKPFFTTKDIGKGTGLGLATTYRIMEAWKGSINVESVEGQGTSFHLLMRRCDAHS